MSLIEQTVPQKGRTAGRGFSVSLLLLTAIFASGCQQETPDTSEVLDDSWFTLEEDAEGSSAIETSPMLDSGSSSQSLSTSQPPLQVDVQAGDQFPLKKVVEKTLTQQTDSRSREHRERIELHLVLSVKETSGQEKRFGVEYQRVVYDSNLQGQSVHYDSRESSGSVPQPALPYHGMVGQGFSFWVGADNRVSQVVDFENFLRNCLKRVPATQAENVKHFLRNYTGHQGVASFVDETIGLLPYDPSSPDRATVVETGGHWSKSHQFHDPVPMTVDTTYTLQELNEKDASIEITGEISPSRTTASRGPQPMTLSINGGSAVGSCVVDRQTGLPRKSRVEHFIEMTVEVGALQFDQQKKVVTSIQMNGQAGPDSPLTVDLDH